MPRKRISFYAVYQDGKAEYKHMIIQYPPNDGDWYILKCDEHGVHFNLNPLHGGAKHLHSSQHNNMSKEHSHAIAVLGHHVFDCDSEKATMNNAVVRKAFEAGYKPFNRNQLTKAERLSLGFEFGLETASARSTPAKPMPASLPPPQSPASASPFTGVAYPVAGELYLGFWSKSKTKYAVILLPWGDLTPAGMVGTLSNTGLLGNPPSCYIVDRMSQEIRGWAQGYEDGGPLVTKREFPVMYFDGSK
jgi:hypothetical protein